MDVSCMYLYKYTRMCCAIPLRWDAFHWTRKCPVRQHPARSRYVVIKRFNLNIHTIAIASPAGVGKWY